MERYNAIYHRKSVRDYSSKGLPKNEFATIEERIEDLSPLYEDIEWEILVAEDGQRVQETFSGLKSKLAKVDAPHYLVGTSQAVEGHLINMGYILEDLVLYLADKGWGTCWLGAGFDENLLEEIYNLEYDLIILVAFGDSAEGKKNLRDDPKEANRKPLNELIINDVEELNKPWKKIISAVKLAPSALNSQPWRFYFNDRGMHLFIENKGVFKSLIRKIGDLDKLNRIDTGIALKHLEIAADNYSLDIEFEDLDMKKEGMEYITSIT